MKYKIYSDGGARGNPGPAGFGFLIYKNENKKPIASGKKYIGKATNNQAEYQGIIAGLTKLYEVDNHSEKVDVYLDSKLIVEQVNGIYKVKSSNIKPLYWELMDIIKQLSVPVKFSHIPREKNKEADKLVNEAIDQKIKDQKSKTKNID